MFALVICTTGSVVSLGLSFPNIHSEVIDAPGIRILSMGCTAPPPSNLWRIFVPSVVIHTILYLFTAYRGLKTRSVAAETAPVVQRLVRE